MPASSSSSWASEGASGKDICGDGGTGFSGFDVAPSSNSMILGCPERIV